MGLNLEQRTLASVVDFVRSYRDDYGLEYLNFKGELGDLLGEDEEFPGLLPIKRTKAQRSAKVQYGFTIKSPEELKSEAGGEEEAQKPKQIINSLKSVSSCELQVSSYVYGLGGRDIFQKDIDGALVGGASIALASIF